MGRDLSELRVEIDSIDRQIVELLKQRMAVANEVAEYKRERDLPVLDSGREQALLITRQLRPDMLETAPLTEKEKAWLASMDAEEKTVL